MQPQTLKTFFRRRAIIVLIVFLLCALVFVYAMQITSVVVLADSAMRARVEYAIGSDASVQSEDYLSRFFSEQYLNTGELQALYNTYDNCTISSYMQMSSVQWVWTWPWGGSAYVKVHEKLSNITGDVVGDETGAEQIPAWPGGIYALTLAKHQGVWLITNMELISLDQEEPADTQTPLDTQSVQPTE